MGGLIGWSFKAGISYSGMHVQIKQTAKFPSHFKRDFQRSNLLLDH
jgi:hypothetical protein